MITDVHERWLAAPPAAVGRLLDDLGGPDDRLWPTRRWPAMRLDRPLSVRARGGHGPIRYHVDTYRAGSVVRFTFERPTGFHGHHEYLVVPSSSGTVLRHSLVMRTSGTARLSWPLLFGPLHDALIEDSLDQAAKSLDLHVARPRRWSRRVRALRVVAGWLAREVDGVSRSLPAQQRRSTG